MAQPRDPLRVAQELQARQPTTPAEVEEQLNLVEELIAAITPRDDYDRAILEALNAVLQSLDADAGGPTEVDTSNLATGRIGRAIYDIPNGSDGQARFNIGGGDFLANITANQSISVGDPVVITGPGNQAEPIPPSDVDPLGDGLAGGVVRVAPDNLLQLQNEVWTSATRDLEPQTSIVSFDGDLTAGDSEVVCEARSDFEAIRMEIREFGTTAHRADIDGDGTDESVIRYHFEYQNEPGGAWYSVPGLPAVQPMGDMVETEAVLDNGALGPVFGFRIRFENRTDDPAYTNTTISQDTLGARITGRIID